MTRIIGVVVLASCVSCASSGANPPAAAPPAPPTPSPTATAAPAKAQPVLPDTPAGKTLAAWLDVFNSGDEPRVQAFVARYKYPQPARELRSFRDRTGGFDLVGIEKSERLAITS